MNRCERLRDHRPVLRHRVRDGIVGESGGQPSDLAVEGRREQHRLPLRPEHLEDPRHVGQEPHVEHPVGLVEHADAHAIQPQELAGHEVEQPPRRGDQDVRMSGPLGLRPEPDAAVDRGDLQAAHVGDRPEVLGHLTRELARRNQDERTRAAAVRDEALDDRDGERQRLARARARPREHVTAGEGVGQHERLDREGGLDPAQGEGVDDRGRDAEGGEAGLGSNGRFGRSQALRRKGLLHVISSGPWFVVARRTSGLPRDREPGAGGSRCCGVDERRRAAAPGSGSLPEQRTRRGGRAAGPCSQRPPRGRGWYVDRAANPLRKGPRWRTRTRAARRARRPWRASR